MIKQGNCLEKDNMRGTLAPLYFPKSTQINCHNVQNEVSLIHDKFGADTINISKAKKVALFLAIPGMLMVLVAINAGSEDKDKTRSQAVARIADRTASHTYG